VFFKANKFNEKRFRNFLVSKKNIILDYGAGIGVWDINNINVKIKNILEKDPNPNAIKVAKKKYNKDKRFIFISKKKMFEKHFFYKNKVNIILLNSVIQYIPRKKLNKMLILFKKKFRVRHWKIIITDVPIHSRFIEIILLMLFDLSRFWHAIQLIFNKDYYSTSFYKDNLDLKYLKKEFNITSFKNLNFFKFRKTIILKKN